MAEIPETVIFTSIDLRDWFAGQALAGLVMESSELCDESDHCAPLPLRVAESAYRIADYMMLARKEVNHDGK